MQKCCKITFHNKEIYLYPEYKHSFIELKKTIKMSMEDGLTNEDISLCNIDQAIVIINNINITNAKHRFIPTEKCANKAITKTNYIDYEERSSYIKRRMYNILLSGESLTLTEIINKIKNIELSRAGWTNHLRNTIKQLQNNGFIVIRERKKYKCTKNQN